MKQNPKKTKTQTYDKMNKQEKEQNPKPARNKQTKNKETRNTTWAETAFVACLVSSFIGHLTINSRQLPWAETATYAKRKRNPQQKTQPHTETKR